MRACILCNVQTSGSVGAAGIHWPSICQTCKDAEDKAALVQTKSITAFWDMLDKRLYK